jgi:Cof subfamily protein (haloacid dehalogenase superfamily)
MYRLLALDLDGTVIGKDLRITDPVRTAVAAAQATGLCVTLVTGRMFRAALPFAQQLSLRDPLICYQGALVRHPLTNAVLHHTPMPGTLAAEAITLLHGAGTCVIACIDERLGIVQDGIPFAGFVRRWGSPDPAHVFVASNLAEIARTTPPTKVMFFGESPLVERELAHLTAHFGTGLSVVRSDATLGELTAPGLSKALALEILARRLGIARENVIAIGDQDNDVPMLQWAGLGLAMGNAPSSVQEMADAVIPSVEEDGVAWAIRRYILNAEATTGGLKGRAGGTASDDANRPR